MLSVVATPIGNLGDISERALETLKSVDAILCEDTRRTGGLLAKFEIQKPLISYHKFKEQEWLPRILDDLKSGKNLALVSDAGTPCINDPGQILVDACLKEGIAVTAIPGACSLIQALVLSGLNSERFQYLGFLPKNPIDILKETAYFPGLSIALESPERLLHTLSLLEDRSVAVLREMTKVYEECRRGPASALHAHYTAHPPKGEIVLILDRTNSTPDLTIEECVELLQTLHGQSLKEAIRNAAHLMNVQKREVYRLFHQNS